VKALYVGTAIGRLEGPQPAPVGGNAVDGAIQDAVALMDVSRCQPALDDNTIDDVRQSTRATQLFEDRLAIGWEQAIPVVMRTEVRRVDQHVEGLSSRESDTRLGPGRGAHVAGRIGCGFATPVDGFELLLGVVGENEVMVE